MWIYSIHACTPRLPFNRTANLISYEDVHHVAAYSVCCIVLTYLCSPAGPCAAWAPALRTKEGDSDSTCWSERTKCVYLRERKRQRFEKEKEKREQERERERHKQERERRLECDNVQGRENVFLWYLRNSVVSKWRAAASENPLPLRAQRLGWSLSPPCVQSCL